MQRLSDEKEILHKLNHQSDPFYQKFLKCLKHPTLLLGGAVRSIMTGETPNDYDVIIDERDRSNIFDQAGGGFDPPDYYTDLGGTRLVDGGCQIDFWSRDAHQQNFPTFEYRFGNYIYAKTVYLTWDAAVVLIEDGTHKQLITLGMDYWLKTNQVNLVNPLQPYWPSCWWGAIEKLYRYPESFLTAEATQHMIKVYDDSHRYEWFYDVDRRIQKVYNLMNPLDGKRMVKAYNHQHDCKATAIINVTRLQDGYFNESRKTI